MKIKWEIIIESERCPKEIYAQYRERGGDGDDGDGAVLNLISMVLNLRKAQ